MAWTVYRSTDASAPVLSGTAGALVGVLDACLVSGYGAKASAGWTTAFTDTNKRVYYNPVTAACRRYVRVNDAAAGTGGAREALIRCYSTMSDINTGTVPMPNTLGTTEGSLVIRKSASADGTGRAWILAADDRTFILFVYAGESTFTDVWFTTYCGEFVSCRPGSTNAWVLMGRSTENAVVSATQTISVEPWYVQSQGAPGSTTRWPQTTLASRVPGCYLGESQAGASSVGQFFLAPAGPAFGTYPQNSTVTYVGVGSMELPNVAESAIYLSPFLVVTSTSNDAGFSIHGHLRGVYGTLHLYNAVSDQDTFSGNAGVWNGKTFQVIKRVVGRISSWANEAGAVSNYYGAGLVILETSTPSTTPAS